MGFTSYRLMTSIAETVHALRESSGRARVVAGGTDLLVPSAASALPESITLLDVSRVEEMRAISPEGSHLLIGAAVTMAELAASPLVREKAWALAQGAGGLGSPQIRHVATIAGNLVTAQPAGDASVPLVALGAEAGIRTVEGERFLPVEDLFRGVRESRIDPCREVVSRFRVPLWASPRRSSSLMRLAKRRAFTLPTLLVAVGLELDEKGERFGQVRIVAAPAGPTPWRAGKAEEALRGAPLTEESIGRAAALAREEARPRDSLRGGAVYRREMVGVLTRRGILECVSRLREEPYA